MKILITGGLGFIGSQLIKRYIDECTKIYIIDNLTTNVVSPESDILQNDTIHFVSMNLSAPSHEDALLLESILQEVSLVFHFASPVGVKYIDSDPKAAVRSLFFTTSVLFPLFEKFKNKVIYASSSEVYGETSDAKENDYLNIGPPDKLRWGYASGKLMSEFMLHSYNFPFVILRFFNITGPGQLPDHGMVLPTFMRCALNNQNLIIHNKGTQVRSFCDIRDAIEIIYRLSSDQNCEGQIFNVGNPTNTIAIKELAELIVNKTNSHSEIVFKNFSEVLSSQSGEINLRTPNISKTTSVYQYQYSINDIIDSFL